MSHRRHMPLRWSSGFVILPTCHLEAEESRDELAKVSAMAMDSHKRSRCPCPGLYPPSAPRALVHAEPYHLTLWRKFGWSAAFVLATAYTTSRAAAGFVTFLWFSGPENRVWQTVTVTGWVTRAVSVSALCIRNLS